MVIMNDFEWPVFSYYVIYIWKVKKVMQQTEKEALNVIINTKTSEKHYTQ